ncbi:MAG TPA: DUF4097 family beta strand repeat-containing protein [Gemmatimonadaceae bacterium]|nr:DUF4097 family beta strand repeat-containing protein [Gemmatimonadaceae bacterium]
MDRIACRVAPCLILALSLPLGAQTEQRTIKGTTVAIYNLAGKLRAEAGTGDAVTVDITRGGHDAAQLKIETGDIRGRQTLRVIYPSDRIVYPDMRNSNTTMTVRDDGTFSEGDWRDSFRQNRVDIRSYGSGLKAYADLVVHVPRGQKLQLFLGVGRVDVANVEGDLSVDVSSADVDVAGTKGNLSLDTGSGRVAVRDATGDLDIDTGSGGLSIDRVTGGELRLDSGSGGVQGTDIDVKVFKADIGSGGLRLGRMKATDIDIDTGSGGASIELMSLFDKLVVETGSGGVTVRAPAALSADVEAETGSGGFQSDFEISTRRVSRDRIEGRIGDGKARIHIEAGSGTVRLLKS